MSDDVETDAAETFEEEVSKGDVASRPNESADPQSVVDATIPQDIREKYEVYSYRSAAVILSQSYPAEFQELMETLRAFKITTRMIRIAGGNESEIPKLLSTRLRPLGWHETIVQGDLVVRRLWKEQVRTTPRGKAVFAKKEHETVRPKFLDGHKVDYVKGKVAFDLEWNSKDQTFDRDLYAMSAFATCGVVDVGVLLTRGGQRLTDAIKTMGPALKKDGTEERTSSGALRPTSAKYGASTTWMGKLLYRLNAGRNAGCPVLAIGITPECIEDWP